MQLRNCSKCGKIFGYVSKRICPECQAKMEEEFDQIRTFVKANPGATVAGIVEALDIDMETVNEFIRQGRSDVVITGVAFECKRCGAEIYSGQYCEKCSSELDRELRGSVTAPGEAAKAQPTANREDKSKLFAANAIFGEDARRKG